MKILKTENENRNVERNLDRKFIFVNDTEQVFSFCENSRYLESFLEFQKVCPYGHSKMGNAFHRDVSTSKHVYFLEFIVLLFLVFFLHTRSMLTLDKDPYYQGISV